MPMLVILLLVLLNGLFVAAEFAIIGVRPTQLEQKAEAGHANARRVLAVLRSRGRQDRYIATAQLGITIASLGLGMYGEPQVARFIEPALARLIGADPHDAFVVSAGALIALGLLSYLHVVVGEMVPKSLALSRVLNTVLAVFRPMRVAETLFAIPVHILNAIGAALLRLLRIPPAGEHARLHSPEELEMIVSESAGVGLLDKREERMIRKIFDFGEREVNQVMTPRPRVQAIPHDAPLPEILKLVTESRYSRFPVFEGSLDNIIGTLHLKDVVRQQIRASGNFDIHLLLRPALAAPEHLPVEKLLATFKRQRSHIAVILDEYGGTAGIVTLEDLVEEIVGEVRDEFDLESEPLLQLAPGVLEVPGSFLLDDLGENVNLGREQDFPDVETVGGLIMVRLGRLPRVGDKVVSGEGVHFTVVAVDGLAVARARIEFQEEGRLVSGGLSADR